MQELSENTSDLLKSFFKLDFHDSPIKTRQKFYMSNLISPVNGTRLSLCALDVDCQNISSVPNITTEWGALGMNVPDPPVLNWSWLNTIVDTIRDVPIPRFTFDMDNRKYWLFLLLVKRKYLLKH